MAMKRGITVLLAMILLACTCGAAAEEKTIQVRTLTGTYFQEAENHPAIEGESPLTGLPCGEAYTPIMVPLDNSPEAHPLWGIGDASLMIQVPITPNGGTRLLALFGDAYPEQAGGIRSGRMTMLPFARAFHAVFAYAGLPPIGNGNVNVKYWLDQWSFLKPTRHYNLLGKRFRTRVDFIKVPYNLSAHIRELHEHLVERGLEFEVRPFLFTDEPLDRGEEAMKISLQFRSAKNPSSVSPNSSCTFSWQPGTGYIRTAAAGETEDRITGKAVPFANVIIMRVPVEWVRDYPYYTDQMRGSGQADIFQSGRYIQGYWSHSTRSGRLVFLDENGKELKFQRGKTYIAVWDDHITASYSGE